MMSTLSQSVAKDISFCNQRRKKIENYPLIVTLFVISVLCHGLDSVF